MSTLKSLVAMLFLFAASTLQAQSVVSAFSITGSANFEGNATVTNRGTLAVTTSTISSLPITNTTILNQMVAAGNLTTTTGYSLAVLTSASGNTTNSTLYAAIGSNRTLWVPVPTSIFSITPSDPIVGRRTVDSGDAMDITTLSDVATGFSYSVATFQADLATSTRPIVTYTMPSQISLTGVLSYSSALKLALTKDATTGVRSLYEYTAETLSGVVLGTGNITDSGGTLHPANFSLAIRVTPSSFVVP